MIFEKWINKSAILIKSFFQSRKRYCILNILLTFCERVKYLKRPQPGKSSLKQKMRHI